MTPPLVRAAGAVLWRPSRSGDGIDVGIVHRPKYDDWSLPKGKADPGEHILVTAVREVAEETGHRVVLGQPLPSMRYRANGGIKEVRYWTARADDSAPPWLGTKEIDRLEFVNVKRAVKRLTQQRDGDLVLRTAQLLGSPAEATSPLVLLRHGKAVSRSRWKGRDGERPLEPKGTVQAEKLVPLLRSFGVAHVVTSDATRCVETVRPLADAIGVPLELEPRLSERAREEKPGVAGRVVEAEVEGSRAVALCSHRPVLPDVMGAVDAVAAKDVRRSGLLDTALTPGAFLVLHRRDGRVVAAEYHEP